METISGIPFYRSIEEQSPRLPWANGNTFNLLVSANYLLPFSIGFDTGDMDESMLESCELYKYSPYGGTYVKDIPVDSIIANGFTSESDSERSSFYYSADAKTSLGLEQGPHYLKLTFNLIPDAPKPMKYTVYSEVFNCVADSFLDDCLELLWKSPLAPYNENRLYFQTDVGMPDYLFEEEGETRDTIFFPTKQISYKKYKFVLCIPEFVCDALRTVRMSDDIMITSRGKTYLATSFSMDSPSWLDDGFYAKVECEFTTGDIIKKTGWR